MKNLIIIVLSLFVFQVQGQVTHNEDGSCLHINMGKLIITDLSEKQVEYTVVLPGVKLSSAINDLLGRIKARGDTDIWLYGINYKVIYVNKEYCFNNMIFRNKSDLIKYLNLWLMEKIVKNQ